MVTHLVGGSPSEELAQEFPAGAGDALLAIARAAIAARWGTPRPTVHADWLERPGASFVTLKHAGELRGCIGTVEARRSLRDDVAANAVAAAFHDTRFPPIEREELPGVRIEVSVLSPLEALAFATEGEALRLLRPGLDGVLLECGRHRATFLPQMWSRFPRPRAFLARLKAKAQLPARPPDELRLWRYTATVFRELPDEDRQGR